MSRAASSLEKDSHYRSNDHLALLLVPTLLSLFLRISLFRRIFSRFMAPKGIYEYTTARTRYIDSVFRQVLADGFEQVLIFGAGFDTRALRFEAEAGRTRIFELDVPTTQQAKIRQYKKRGLPTPANLEFVPVDFDRESLPTVLAEAGFRCGAKSFFLLEGLLMYLQQESVDETFRVIAELSGRDSIVAFDYIRMSAIRRPESCYGGTELFRAVEKVGETYSFGIEDGELELFLRKYGLSLSEKLRAMDLEQRYFTDSSGRTVGRVNETHCIVKASKT